MVKALWLLLVLIVLAVYPVGLGAQDGPSSPATVSTAAPALPNGSYSGSSHRFWDRENLGLFAGVAGGRMLDYASTRHFRNQGNYEWLLTNSVVDNRPLFVGIELAGTAASIGVSYVFHRTGHHTLERWVSIGHIGVAVGGSIHNYELTPPARSAQPKALVQASSR